MHLWHIYQRPASYGHFCHLPVEGLPLPSTFCCRPKRSLLPHHSWCYNTRLVEQLLTEGVSAVKKALYSLGLWEL